MMRRLSAVSLVSSIVLGMWGVIVYAQETPAKSSVGTGELPSTLMSSQEIEALLQPERHLPNPSAVSIFERSSNRPPEFASSVSLYVRQREAIKQVGTRKLSSLVPQLIAFSDYPGVRGASLSVSNREQMFQNDVSDAWPTFGAILAIGEAAIPRLEEYVRNDNHELRLRLTALQILQEMDPERSKMVGQALLAEADKNGHKGAAKRIGLILENKLGFWGMIDFSPITLSMREISDLLSASRHLKDVQSVLIKEDLRRGPTATGEWNTHYELYVHQKQAIHDAGELGAAESVPNLLLFLDYPRSLLDVLISSPGQSLETKRRVWPALDAVLKIGKPAVPSLKSFIRDSKRVPALRLRALMALRQIEPQRAEAVGEWLSDEFEKAGNAKMLNATKSVLEPGTG